MNHDERIEIAREIADQIVSRYDQDIIGITVYGSVAKGEDAEHSDLELWIATTDQLPSREVLCIYQGLCIELFYGLAEGFIADAQHVDPLWPIRADMRRSCLVLYERDDFFERLRQAARMVNEDDFFQAMKVRMLRTYDLVGKLRNAWTQQDHYGVLTIARDMTFSFSLLIGLANRRYYPSQRGMYQQSKQMPLQPEHYAELVEVAGGFTNIDTEQVYRAAIELWEQVRHFVERLGIVWERDELII
jgi:hypothetical protein